MIYIYIYMEKLQSDAAIQDNNEQDLDKILVPKF